MHLPGSPSKAVWITLGAILALQAAALRRASGPEMSGQIPDLHMVPLQLGRWNALGEENLESRVTEYLKPDDYILRDYLDRTDGAAVSVFVAYFKSLQSNYGPHSPRVCLPGAGWLVRSSKIAPLAVPGRQQGIPVNEYVLEKGADHILVLYWYQNDRDVWAEEFHAKLQMLPDLMYHRRSDVSLVRVITRLAGPDSENGQKRCIEFANLVFPQLVECFARAGS